MTTETTSNPGKINAATVTVIAIVLLGIVGGVVAGITVIAPALTGH